MEWKTISGLPKYQISDEGAEHTEKICPLAL